MHLKSLFAMGWLAGLPGWALAVPFAQDPLPDGVVVVEAEHYHASTTNSGASWVPVASGSYSGGAALQAMPNNGLLFNSNVESQSPRLDYQVAFVHAGIHYVAVRGFAKSGADDSVHAGLNGVLTADSDRIGTFSSSGSWKNRTFETGTPLIMVDVPFPGVHTLNLWMREDGFIADKIVLSTSPHFLPTGGGPPESLQVGDSDPDSDAPGATAFSSIRLVDGQIEVAFEPVAAAEAYAVAGAGELDGTPLAPVPAAVDGFTARFDPTDGPAEFLAVQTVSPDSDRVWAAALLNRIAYGPTPELIERVLTGPSPIGAQGYLDEQLAPELIPESVVNDPAWQYFDARLRSGAGNLTDLQAWHLLSAIGADRQLLEILVQFFDNHFPTYYWKTRDWFRTQGFSDTDARVQAASLEFREQQRWRSILLDPNATFRDLLMASCESPAMIIYLDTVGSRSNAPNENFSREIMELFTMGVDNGYSQTDIERMSPAWTGWQVGPVDPAHLGDPHAPAYASPAPLFDLKSTGWSYRKGLAAPPVDWNQPGHVPDTNWIDGAALAIGYGNTNVVTTLADMRNSYNTVYLRREWVVPPGTDLDALRLRVLLDDGCILYVNGIEAARINVHPNTDKAHDGTADVSVGTAAWITAAAPDFGALLQPGTNLLAVHLLNQSRGSSDLAFDLLIDRPAAWDFVFNPAVHHAGAKTIFSNLVVDARFASAEAGASYALTLPVRGGTNGIADGYAIIDHLADLPHTREFICYKLCGLLVHDRFPFKNYYNLTRTPDEAALLREAMAAWATPGPDGRTGNIRAVVRTILESDLFRSQAAANQKVKTPFEYVVSAVRALRADLGGGMVAASTLGLDLATPMGNMGMRLFERFDPDGWAEEGAAWIDTGTVNERLRFVQHMVRAPNDPQKTTDYGNTGTNTVTRPTEWVMARLPSEDWTDAAAVTDFFLAHLFAGEGWPNFAAERAAAIDLLNSDDTGVPGSAPFALAVPGSANYDLRIRSLVGLLLAGPRFHEQ
jgi:uncharacterized protein (DUF1800 family)